MKPVLFFFMALTLTVSSCNSVGQQKKIQQPASPSLTKLYGEVIQKVPEKSYQGLKPGDIAPDAVKLNADEICNMINGAILIKKGSASALIDINGKFIVPWGKYQFLDDCNHLASNIALFKVVNPATSAMGYLNTTGKAVVPLIFSNIEVTDRIRPVSAVTKDGKDILVTLQDCSPLGLNKADTAFYGQAAFNVFQTPDRVRLQKDIQVHDEKLHGTVSKKLFGYTSSNGAVVILPQFKDASEFSEGLAAVQKTDEFGVDKWGYIDKTGKLVIPFKFSVQPGDFHEGLALVVPVGASDFDYAYIDKSGDIKIKVGDGKRGNNMYYPTDGGGTMPATGVYTNNPAQNALLGGFKNGYSCWRQLDREVKLMDHRGNLHTLTEIAQDKSLSDGKSNLRVQANSSLGFLFTRTQSIQYNQTGLLNYKGETLFPPVFDHLYPDYLSRYAIATIFDTQKNKLKITGVVNSQGVFVIVIDNNSTF